MGDSLSVNGFDHLMAQENYRVFTDGMENLFVRGINLEDGYLTLYCYMSTSGHNLRHLKNLQTVELKLELDQPFVILFEVSNPQPSELSLGYQPWGCPDDDWEETDAPPPTIGFRMKVESTTTA